MLYSFSLFFSRWEDDWWCFFENYWSLTSLQLSALPLPHWSTIISQQAPGSFAYSTQWPLHCGGVQCFTASCSFSVAFTVHKVSYHGVMWQRVVLMWFWSTFQQAGYYSAYEWVEFISTRSSVCAISSSLLVLPLEFKKRFFDTLYWTHWIYLTTHGPSLKHNVTSITTLKRWVRGLPLKVHNCTFSEQWAQ